MFFSVFLVFCQNKTNLTIIYNNYTPYSIDCIYFNVYKVDIAIIKKCSSTNLLKYYTDNYLKSVWQKYNIVKFQPWYLQSTAVVFVCQNLFIKIQNTFGRQSDISWQSCSGYFCTINNCAILTKTNKSKQVELLNSQWTMVQDLYNACSNSNFMNLMLSCDS